MYFIEFTLGDEVFLAIPGPARLSDFTQRHFGDLVSVGSVNYLSKAEGVAAGKPWKIYSWLDIDDAQPVWIYRGLVDSTTLRELPDHESVSVSVIS